MNPEDAFKFKQGDVVVHVSGGPNLAVLYIQHRDISTPEKPVVVVQCQWWDQASNSFKKDVFSQDLLKLA